MLELEPAPAGFYLVELGLVVCSVCIVVCGNCGAYEGCDGAVWKRPLNCQSGSAVGWDLLRSGLLADVSVCVVLFNVDGLLAICICCSLVHNNRK